MNVRKRIVSLLFLIAVTGMFLTKPVLAAECGLAKIEEVAGGNSNVSYCISSPNKSEVQSVASITAICRRAPGGTITNLACHEDWQNALFAPFAPWTILEGGPKAISTTQTVSPGTIITEGGISFTCFTLNSLSRDMGVIEVQLKNASGNLVCPTQSTPVTPGDYTLIEYFDKTLNRVGIDITTASEKLANLMCADRTSLKTAIGCIPTDPQGFVKKFLSLGIGMAGGIAFFLILVGGLQILTSAGNPERLTAGKELVGSAIAGLLLLIFSIFLLKIIGVDILAIPGFGT